MKKNKFSILLVCLLFILCVYPFVEKNIFSGQILALFFTLVLIVGTFAVSAYKRRNLIISLFLAIPATVLVWAHEIFDSLAVDVSGYLFMTLFSFFTFFCIVSHIMSVQKVTNDILAGAASAYILMGISWGMLCATLELINPGSFMASKALGPEALTKWATFNYYSFTTLTTVGYGDITAVSIRAQSFAILEAVAGVLFIALLISRLVGMYLYQISKEND